MKKNIDKRLVIISLMVMSVIISGCKDEKADDHANTPRSEPGEGYKTSGPSAGDNSDTCKIHKHK